MALSFEKCKRSVKFTNVGLDYKTTSLPIKKKPLNETLNNFFLFSRFCRVFGDSFLKIPTVSIFKSLKVLDKLKLV